MVEQVHKEMEFLKVLEGKDLDLGNCNISNENLFKDLDRQFEMMDKSFYLETLILQDRSEEFFLLVQNTEYHISPQYVDFGNRKKQFQNFSLFNEKFTFFDIYFGIFEFVYGEK